MNFSTSIGCEHEVAMAKPRGMKGEITPLGLLNFIQINN